jgi:hypothetical protein
MHAFFLDTARCPSGTRYYKALRILPADVSDMDTSDGFASIASILNLYRLYTLILGW